MDGMRRGEDVLFQTHFRLSLFIITRVYLPESALGEAGEKKRKRKKGKAKRLWTHKYTNRRNKSLLWRVWVRALIWGS